MIPMPIILGLIAGVVASAIGLAFAYNEHKGKESPGPETQVHSPRAALHH